MRVLTYKIDVSLFIDLIALYMNPNATFVTMYDLMIIGNRLFRLLQVFDERQELIKTMKGSRLKKDYDKKDVVK